MNPVDPAARERWLYIGQPPFTLGWDVSDLVEQVGTGVSRFEVGEEVYGMRELSSLVAAGQLNVHVSQTFPLEEAAAAHRAMEDGHVTGKIVLTID
ncbi:zinc-binding dehydrogenase [Glycomyces buryatensis]|uniref:Alcohol dehydrogenase-like N-terminal domain-containing protein n=1 Tax=Glycomyces buryatensis TaxID=2570927 RepID=A0A4S8QGP9_9ACTN|nr:zinc-binding dehydrogenase [Glycomyces buryatensis]THV42352.1 hypothetical protein FAB82_06760 [Glycomyces buryatensis]